MTIGEATARIERAGHQLEFQPLDVNRGVVIIVGGPPGKDYLALGPALFPASDHGRAGECSDPEATANSRFVPEEPLRVPAEGVFHGIHRRL